MKKNKFSKTVWFKDEDLEAHALISVFKNTDFEYSSVTGRPVKFQYLDLLNNIKWIGLKPKDYMSLLKAMCKKFIASLPE